MSFVRVDTAWFHRELVLIGGKVFAQIHQQVDRPGKEPLYDVELFHPLAIANGFTEIGTKVQTFPSIDEAKAHVRKMHAYFREMFSV